MIQMYNSGPMRDKKLLSEAQQMLADSRAKIEYIKMRIMKVNQAKAETSEDQAAGGRGNKGKGKRRGEMEG